jgi:hypothetical protein
MRSSLRDGRVVRRELTALSRHTSLFGQAGDVLKVLRRVKGTQTTDRRLTRTFVTSCLRQNVYFSEA